jgi:hypothetical protein
MNIIDREILNFDINVVEEQAFPVAEYRVVLTPDDGPHSTHEVTLSENYWQELTGGKMSGQDLVEATFEFLLQRESNDAIMNRFDLSVMAEYWPEYENEIKRRY